MCYDCYDKSFQLFNTSTCKILSKVSFTIFLCFISLFLGGGGGVDVFMKFYHVSRANNTLLFI